jgi:hypothetical protein
MYFENIWSMDKTEFPMYLVKVLSLIKRSLSMFRMQFFKYLMKHSTDVVLAFPLQYLAKSFVIVIFAKNLVLFVMW